MLDGRGRGGSRGRRTGHRDRGGARRLHHGHRQHHRQRQPAPAGRAGPAAQRAAGNTLRIFGGTITPFGGSFVDTPQRRQVWQSVNAWIRTSHAFDAVIDFAAATAVPGDPYTLQPEYDSGDHLHPNDAGCQAMADAIPLRLLR